MQPVIQAVQPLIDYKPVTRAPYIPAGKRLCEYDHCPSCFRWKKRSAKLCIKCCTAALHPAIDASIYIVEGEPTKRLPLTKGRYTIVDEGEYDRLFVWKMWTMICGGKHYAGARCSFSDESGIDRIAVVKVHHILLRIPSSVYVDHKNGDTLDNRRANLRICTQSENIANVARKPGASGYVGVWFDKRRGRYSAFISTKQGRLYLGTFKNPLDAAIARDAAAVKHLGEFAVLNFPTSENRRSHRSINAL